MTKISNQRVYIPDTDISNEDYFIGTDADNSLKTVNFKIGEVGSHYNMVNGIKNFDFNFYEHINPNPNPIDGGFYSNDNNKDPNNITYFIFSKKTASNKIIATFFENLIALNPFDLTISQKIDVMSTFYFKIDNIESFPNYYKINVSEIYFAETILLEYVLSFNMFSLKSSGVTQHNNLLGLNEGDYIHLTSAEKATFDSLPTNFAAKTSELINDGEDGTSFYIEDDDARLSDARTPLTHTHTESDITDLDKYTQAETDNLLLTKEYLINKSTTFETDKTSDDKYPSVKSVDEIIVKKSFSQPLYYSYTGSNVIIPLLPTGSEKFYFVNNSLVSISGFNLSLITGNPSAEIPYNGKEIIMFNGTANPITINHNAVADIPYIIKDAADLVVPSGELVRFMYEDDEMKELFRSWSSAVASDNYFTYESAGFKVNVTAGLVNIWLRNNLYVQYDLYFDESTGITDKSLIIPDVRSVVYKVPQDCFLEELSTRRPPAGNGKILIWKTASDSVSSTPIEILYKLIDNTFAAGGGLMGSVFYGENIPLLKGEYLHFFFTADINTAWWNKIFIRFKKQ